MSMQGSQTSSYSHGGNELTLLKIRSHFYQTPHFITEDIEITIVGQGIPKVPGHWQPVQWNFQVVYSIYKKSEDLSESCQGHH